jgi:biopolymer transport protein ExbB
VTVFGAVRALVDGAGIFAAPLVALAFATFALASWAALRLRDVELRAARPRRMVRDVTRALRLLGAAASAAPLVGLLGTVDGLIALFGGLEQAGAYDRDVLTRGVGQALFTTEFGLAIAVPGIVLHAAIRRSLRARAGALIHTAGTGRRRSR